MHTRRPAWPGLAVLMLPTFIVAMDTTALLLALPRLGTDLGATAVEQLWISDSYGFMVAGTVVAMGTLGDRIGRRRLLLAGAAAFAALSVAAAFTTDPGSLIAVRALLGIAGATLAPATLGLIIEMFPDPRKRGKAVALWAACQFTGGALGPVVAGILLQHFWWGAVFLAAVPAMAVLLAAGPVLLPASRGDRTAALGLPDVALSLAAVLLTVHGIKQAAVHGTTADTPRQFLVPALALAAGAVLGGIFARRQLRARTPLLDLRLLRDRPSAAVLAALVGAGIALAGTGLLVTQYLQNVHGRTPAATALLFAPVGLGVAAGTLAAPALARRMPPATAIAGGLALSAAGGLLLAATGTARGTADLLLIVTAATVLALGTGPLFALGTGLVVGSVPPERAGSAAAVSETGNYIGGSLGFALLGTLAAAIYRERTDGSSESPAAAAAASRDLPADEAARLLNAAHDACTAGMRATGLVCAAVLAALAVLVTAAMRPASDRAQAGRPPENEPPATRRPAPDGAAGR
ncbi:MFS transporter [Yinghuangia soli]|uniref:MFS transporter n=1 Tax=Yinghuangia soli TaxID=2908204 RepID=A0AA41Q768_9ACTN|nr:MFS transporter [Yinghuangia soli]MCF2532205.1 MFS transporter [Yinghuangia soli]